ncbi:MAG: (d)CMP kinase [Lentisphaerota bacterium]
MKNVIAIDGPAASGKSTIANLLAAKLGIYYINTGNMYRAATLIALEKGIDLNNTVESDFEEIATENQITYEKGKDGKLVLIINSSPANLEKIRSPEVASFVSVVSKSKAIRDWLVGEQREMVKLGAILMEGRDIGTNVFPDAKFKFFLTASPEVRAKRRLAQSGETLEGATVASVAKDIAMRDEIDSKREIAPLKKADDAILVDSSNLTIEEMINKIIGIINSK